MTEHIDRDALRKLAMGASHVGATVHLTAETALALLGQLDQAEARIKAVEDVLDAWDRSEHHDSLEVGIRRALDLPYLGSPDECCGRGICALGQGHSGPCRC